MNFNLPSSFYQNTVQFTPTAPVVFGSISLEKKLALIERILAIEAFDPRQSMYFDLLLGLSCPERRGTFTYGNTPRILALQLINHLNEQERSKLEDILTIAESAKPLKPEQIKGLAKAFRVPLDNRDELVERISHNKQGISIIIPSHIPKYPSKVESLLAIYTAAEKDGRLEEFKNLLPQSAPRAQTS